jgi:hypothetical protein
VEAEVELLLQTIVVAAAVVASTLYAAWRLTPAKTRYRMLSSLNADTASVVGRWLAGLKKKVADEVSHGCNACSQSSNPVKKHAPRQAQ